jgi:hypothetical protein
VLPAVGDVGELPVAVGVGRAGEALAVGPQAVTPVAQQLPDGGVGDLVATPAQQLGQAAGAGAGPAAAAGGAAGGLLVQQLVEGGR